MVGFGFHGHVTIEIGQFSSRFTIIVFQLPTVGSSINVINVHVYVCSFHLSASDRHLEQLLPHGCRHSCFRSVTSNFTYGVHICTHMGLLDTSQSSLPNHRKQNTVRIALQYDTLFHSAYGMITYILLATIVATIKVGRGRCP